MTPSARHTPLLLLVMLAGCAGPPLASPGPGSQADSATQAACRQRAEEVYDRRHRDSIYSPSQATNTPYSGAYAAGVPNRGLSQIYERDSLIRDCVRNVGTETDRGPGPTAPGLLSRP